MTSSIQDIAEAFSSHRFAETVEHLAPDVQWVLVGDSILEGREAVAGACEESAAELAGVSVEFTRFVSVAGSDVVAVDAVGRYVDDDSAETSVVSSCDIYEFNQDLLTKITSYAVELSAL